jgi:hypothetical protein
VIRVLNGVGENEVMVMGMKLDDSTFGTLFVLFVSYLVHSHTKPIKVPARP